MPYIEQLLYGYNHLTETNERQGLAHSAGMGADVSAEIGAVCNAWGQMPELGLNRRVLLGHPLQSTMPSMRGRLYTVICVGAGTVPLFHAVVVTDAAYSSFGRNPYALAQAVAFAESWNGNQGMDRVEIEAEGLGKLVDPPANPDDVGLIDEAVLQFMLTGNLQLPLEQTVGDSERAMALIIACLPDEDRKDLKFASFTTAKVNAYDISCLATEGAAFAGWQRLMMARIDTGVSEQQQEYKTLIAQYLARGDMAGIARVSSRHDFSVPSFNKPLVATRQGAPVSRKDPPESTNVRPPVPIPFGPAATIAGGSGLQPIAALPGAVPRRGPLSNRGLDPIADHSPKPIRARGFRRNRSRVPISHGRGKRGAGSRFMRTISVLLILFCAGWVGTMWLEGRTLAESLEWAGLPGMDGHVERADHAGTLLEVVDVGQVYDRALKHVGNKGLGLNASGDRRREKAMGRLQSAATDPLLEQASLFVKLSAEGIQQSGRPDREVERLESLAGQGAVIDKEMARLELAWYSLATGVNWVDLSKLSDTAVEARRDSLSRAEKGSLKDVRLGLGTIELYPDLVRAQRQMEGMAAVVRLFQTAHWSPVWEKNLAAAAEKVSPSAGKTTRAYRNSAFALLRLKRAERTAANRDLPFATPFAADGWPCTNVKEILPLLRKEVGRFSSQNAPDLLGATLALYAVLEVPDKTIDHIRKSARSWRELQANSAVMFDPDSYGNFLERLRFEGAQRCLTALNDPAEIPSHLYAPEAGRVVTAFGDSLVTLTRPEQWRALAADIQDPFLRQWADHRATDIQAGQDQLRQEFAAVWADCRTQAAFVQAQARAGHDWSEPWRKLYTVATAAADTYTVSLGDDPTQQPRIAYLDTLVQALMEPQWLHISRVTVRLDQNRLSEPCEVQLELRTPERDGIRTSELFLVGPAAQAGKGWVGTAFLDWDLSLSPHHQMTGRVVTAADHSELCEVHYSSLIGGGGAAALTRPQLSRFGSVVFQAGLADYWRALKIPESGPIF